MADPTATTGITVASISVLNQWICGTVSLIYKYILPVRYVLLHPPFLGSSVQVWLTTTAVHQKALYSLPITLNKKKANLFHQKLHKFRTTMFNLAFQHGNNCIFICLSILTLSTPGKFAVSRRVMQRIFQIETDVNICLTHIQSIFSTSKSSTGFFMSSDCIASFSSSSEPSRARLHWLSWSWSKIKKNNVMYSH